MADIPLVTSQGLDQLFVTAGQDASGAVMICQQPPEHLLLQSGTRCVAIASLLLSRYNAPSINVIHPDARLIDSRRPRTASRALAGLVTVEPPSRRQGRATRMDPLADFAQLELHFVDQIQWRYEVIRPIVLFNDRTAAQRAVETHTHPETVRKLTRRFRQRGPPGLFPVHTEILMPSRGQQVPPEVVEELARLKTLYVGFQFRELARIIHYKCNYRIDDKTVKKLWQQSPELVQGELPLGTYHSHPQRYQARLQVIKLYYQLRIDTLNRQALANQRCKV